MSEIKCPYCGHEQDVNHDDGVGYDESVEHEQFCTSCDKEFKFTTYVSYSYTSYCFNHNDHNLVQCKYQNQLLECTNCSYYELAEEN